MDAGNGSDAARAAAAGLVAPLGHVVLEIVLRAAAGSAQPAVHVVAITAGAAPTPLAAITAPPVAAIALLPAAAAAAAVPLAPLVALVAAFRPAAI